MKKGYIKYNNFAKEKEKFCLNNFNNSIVDKSQSGLGLHCQYWTNYNGIYLPNIVFDQTEEDVQSEVISEWKNQA